MIRSRVLFSAVILALCSANALGLGTGRLELYSALNQNFSAEIELINTANLEPEEILPGLASQDDFERFGVDRAYLLTFLRFSVERDENGDYYIELTSTRPIHEPFLNFIVEVRWPSGRIVKEYTVLLDPPVFGTQSVTDVAPATSTSTSAPVVAQPMPARPVPAAPTSASSMGEGEVFDEEYGVTGPGDTLWSIALKVRPSESVSVQQTMLALQRLNPDAFINNNINLLKAGHVLRIPELSEIESDTVQGAVSEVRAQNAEFEEYRATGVAQMDATRRQRSDAPADDGEADGELKLVASSRSSGQRAGDSDSAAVADLENELAIARDDLDRAHRANSELNVRLDDLEGQLETLNEIVKLKDDQLAAWKAELQKVQEAEVSAPPAPAAQPAPQTQGSLLTNPLVLGGLGIVVVGGLVAGMIFLRRRKQDTDEEPEFEEEVAEEPLSLEDDEEQLILEAEPEADEDLTQQTSDVISEAEIYIAYGRFPQAITFLQNAVDAEPNRTDIQLKLLEVYVQTEDATAFNLLLDQLKTSGDEDAIQAAEEMQQQIPGAAETAAAAMDATIVSSEPIEAIEEAIDDDDDDLSFDLDDLDAETADEDLDLDLSDDLDDDLDADDLDLALDDSEELDLDGDTEELALDLDDSDDLDLDDSDELDLDLDTESEELDLDLGDEELDLDLGDEELDIDLDDTLSLDEDESVDLDETVSLDEDEIDLDLEDDLDDTVALSEDEIDLDLEDDLDDTVSLDENELDLGSDEVDELSDTASLDADDLDLGDDLDELDLGDLDDDDDAISLDLDDDDFDLEAELADEGEAEVELDDDDDDTLSLDLDEEIDLDDLDLEGAGEQEEGLDLGDADDELDLGDLDDEQLDLSDLEDDDISLDLDEDDSLDLDDDLGELNLDEDAASKLDLARAYIDMGDADGARTLLNEVISEGDETQVGEANELLGKLD